MIINIPKMQSGGGIPPFATYTPVTVNNAVSTAASSNDDTSAKEKGGLTDKDLLSLLKDIDGLPNDMNAVVGYLQRFYTATSGETDPAMLAAQYTRAIQQIKTANFNKKEFDKAYETVSNNKGLNEIAITDSGHICVVSKDNPSPQSISVQEYLRSPENYMVLTNSNLLSMRANNQDMVMDNSILGVVENGIGTEKVNELIHNFINKIGSSTLLTQGYAKTKGDEVIEGVQYIQNLVNQGVDVSGMSIEGLYKTGLSTKDQAEKAKMALNYVYNMLPENAKTLLMYKAGSAEGAKGLVAQYIGSGLDSERKVTIDMIRDKNGRNPNESEVTGDKDRKTDLVQQVQVGDGGTQTTVTINKGTQYQMSADGTYYMALVDKSGGVVGNTTLANMLEKTGIQGIIDPTQISFGDQVISQDDLSNIIYRNAGGIRAYLPCTTDSKGRVKPDIEILDRFQEADQAAQARYREGMSSEQKDSILGEELRKAGLDQYIKADGTPDRSKFQLFFMVDGYSCSKTSKFNSDDNQLLEKVDDDNDAAYQLVQDVLNQNKEKGDSKIELDREEFYDFWYDKIYSGTVYIPIISNNPAQAITASGNNVYANTGRELEKLYQSWQKRQSMQNTSLDVL